MSVPQPTLPGTIISFTGAQAPRIVPSAAETVAIPLITDWGPVGADAPGTTGVEGGAQLTADFAAFTALYGDSDTAGRTAAAGAFAGQGLPGYPGAGGVLVWRMAGAGVAVATRSLSSGVTPTLRLDGRYKGTRGNRITVTVDVDPSDATSDRIRIFFDGVLQELYSYKAPALAALAASINTRSSLVRATALVADAAPAGRLAAVAAVALAGGNDGAAPVSTDHLAALAGLEYQQFGIIAPYDLTDSTIQTSYLSWVQSQAQASRPCRLVIGGAAGESSATAISRAAAMNDPHVITIGVGTYHDDLLGKDLSTSQLAPRIAGILAAKGERHAITFAELGGIHAIVGPSDQDLPLCQRSGVVVLAPTSSDDADLHILKGVTTYTLDTTAQPQAVFGSARLVGVMDNYVRGMRQWGDKTVVGNLPVNDDTRNLVRGEARRREDELLRAGLILPGNPNTNPPIPDPWVVCVDPNDPSKEDQIPYTFGWRFAKTANNIVGQGSVL